MVRQPGDGYRESISCISSVKGNLRWLLPYKSFSLSLDFSLPLYLIKLHLILGKFLRAVTGNV